MALHLVLQDISADGRAGFQGAGNLQRGLGKGAQALEQQQVVWGLSHLLPTRGQEEGTAKEVSVPLNPELVVG